MSTIAILFYLALAQELYFWWSRQPLPGPLTAPPLPPKGSGLTREQFINQITTGTVQIQWNSDNTNHYTLRQFPTFEREVIRFGSWDDPMCIKSIPSGVITFEAYEYDENVRAKITDGTR